MLTFPNCKINIGLSVIRKRTDGFHDIETLFYPIPLCDVLEIVISKNHKTKFYSTGLSIPGLAEDNLCLKAYQLLKTDFEIPDVEIHLHKVIPMGAGLGGGSSDAAQTLILLDKLFDLKFSKSQLLEYASKLGADCSFFIINKPVFAYEKGDKFKNINLSLRGYYIIIVKPNIHINTAEAYKHIKPNPNHYLSHLLIEKPVMKWKKFVKNDFEKGIFDENSEIKKIKSQLYEDGAAFASMSGSGSAVFGLFEQPIDLSKKFENCFYWSSKI